jgi:hypothetical protein
MFHKLYEISKNEILTAIDLHRVLLNFPSFHNRLTWFNTLLIFRVVSYRLTITIMKVDYLIRDKPLYFLTKS